MLINTRKEVNVNGKVNWRIIPRTTNVNVKPINVNVNVRRKDVNVNVNKPKIELYLGSHNIKSFILVVLPFYLHHMVIEG